MAFFSIYLPSGKSKGILFYCMHSNQGIVKRLLSSTGDTEAVGTITEDSHLVIC